MVVIDSERVPETKPRVVLADNHEVEEMAPSRPEWKEKEPFKSVLARDNAAMSKFTEADWMQIIALTHAGMSTEAFQGLVKQWLAKAKAPPFDRPYTDLVYQPMLEVMKYLCANGFRTYIVTGGGQEFVHVYSEQVYGVPPEQVVGSSIATKYVNTNGKPALMREPKPFFIDDGQARPSGSISSSASGQLPLSATPRATPRCSNGRRRVKERA